LKTIFNIIPLKKKDNFKEKVSMKSCGWKKYFYYFLRQSSTFLQQNLHLKKMQNILLALFLIVIFFKNFRESLHLLVDKNFQEKVSRKKLN
jgi:hypothetical protein